MNGFDSEFKNLKDFILKITYRIWEERGVERIRDYYGEKAPVKTPTSVSDNVEDVISSTYKTLQMFPDRELLGEDVIGSEDVPGTFYSSHRILSILETAFTDLQLAPKLLIESWPIASAGKTR